jgi:hypothetical protein
MQGQNMAMFFKTETLAKKSMADPPDPALQR